MAGAARLLIDALPEGLRARIAFEFDSPQRIAWEGGPRLRDGLALNEMPSECRILALALIASGLSQRGFATVATIMSLEGELDRREQGSRNRDPDRYWLAVFGVPGAPRWGWRVEGHHIAVHLACVDGLVTGTPSFRATNPARVPDGRRAGLRPLGGEEDAARALLLSLAPEQRARAVVAGEAPMDALSGTATRVLPLPLAGIAWNDLDSSQREALLALISRWTGHQRDEVADGMLSRVRATGLERLRFVWMGGDGVGEPHYWRIDGAGLLIEWSNAQNAGNHVHSVVREAAFDFGLAGQG
ncbi:MAG: DUF3500 domain-containing protein [Planctomycetes bacterium]|nr:DUF3500 domain-containing protein [Planctomycetota bacterium]